MSVLLMITAGAFYYWVLSLFSQLEVITSKRSLMHPAVYYSQIVKLKKGMNLSLKEFAESVKSRGYSEKISDTLNRPGQYYTDYESYVSVYLREFVFPGGKKISGKYSFRFKKEKLSAITRSADSQKLEELPLEPYCISKHIGKSPDTSLWVEIRQIPEPLQKAVVLSEDRRFYRHHGVDIRSILRAFMINLRKGSIEQGGSTITQQLVKNAFLTHERTIKRKLIEAALAVMLETKYSKDKILEMYLNQIYLGHRDGKGIYGVENASMSFFGKHASELTLGECATLAGTIPSPGRYNIIKSFETALQRRNHTLELMYQNNIISIEELKEALNEDIKPAPDSADTSASYFLSYVRYMLEDEFTSQVLDYHGYKIFTSMDFNMQKFAEKEAAMQETQCALVAMDQFTGEVKALVGGRNYSETQFNRAIYSLRQPGSAFKPIVYTAALEEGDVTLATLLKDRPMSVRIPGGVWEPENYDGKFSGTITVRDALVFSKNIPSIKVALETGIDNVMDYAYKMGIKTELAPVPSLALGSSEVTLLELTSAYAPFSNGGFSVEPLFVLYVTDEHGRIIKEYPQQKEQAIMPETASLMTDVLQDVVKRGTGKNLKNFGIDFACAGKTGTSDNFNDAWFIGYTPKLLCGVWMGHDKPESMGMPASYLALPLWAGFMKLAYKPAEDEGFKLHPGIETISICTDTGLRARSGCPSRTKEIFLPGCELEDYCPIHSGGIPGFFKRLFK